MQNAPTMLGQKMMNRQAPYGPIGMVSQNMSGNKKGGAAGGGGGGGPVIGLKFDTATATAGVTFSNSDTTVTNTTGGNIASAKANAAVIPNTGNNWYWEFIASGPLNQFLGFGLPNFVCNASNRVGLVTSSVSYVPSTGQVYANGSVQTTIATAAVGDVIGFKLQVFNPGSLLTILKNGVEILSSFDTSVWIANNSVAWTPIWSSNVTSCVATISNNIYSYAGYTPIGASVTTIAASASVPAVADGKYDVYTFNASGTFTVASTGAVRALVIAGGGGSQGNIGGGAGAGGYQEKGIAATPQIYTVTVGAGASTNVGVNSSIAAAVVSNGGGSGGGGGTKNGGSGGGAFRDTVTNNAAGTGISGQGFAGGTVTFTGGATAYSHAGGGGAGAVGGNGSITVGGNGGAGITSSITGTAVARGGGGGGASFDGATDYAGSATAGGGFGFSFGAESNGTANTGGGAGPGGSGGSGVVIIRVRARA